VALPIAGLAIVLAVIFWLMTHPEAGHHQRYRGSASSEASP
jgi:hypothetical protein